MLPAVKKTSQVVMFDFGRKFLKFLDSALLPLLFWNQRYQKEIIYPINNDIKMRMRVHPSDKIAVWETWKYKVYDSTGNEIKSTDVVLDIGAHIGSFAVYAAQKAHQGKVFAYEASKENYDLLKENKKLNHLSNLHVFNAAVSNVDGEITFYEDSSNQGLNSITPIKNGTKRRVKSISLKKILRNNNIHEIDYMKLDVEGAEYDILLATPPQILRKVKFISMEYHEFPHSPHNKQELVQYFRMNGYRVAIDGSFLQKLLFRTGYIKAWRN